MTQKDEEADNDLSPYELARLERIRRNEERLRSLGLVGSSGVSLPSTAPEGTGHAKKARRDGSDANIIRKKRQRDPSVPTRSSRRLRGVRERKEEGGNATNNSAEGGAKRSTSESQTNSNRSDERDPEEPTNDEETLVNYESMPKDPEELDDDEFQVYVLLRAWRLRRKNELEVEPYKICQNRTLCELIRKRRNDVHFASSSNFVAKSACGKEEKDQSTVETELLSVWGVGPSKAAKGGFGWEMVEILDSKESEKHLVSSRNKTTNNH